ncbi:MAG: sensor protein kdpD [Bdellovibrio sp. ArHS]|uniref:sensor histidine kinase n=1 Tax=Bdellovibrio sp. ArHS TaxID=1569284 RepID=UPI0005836A40|nr:ATP-binding protein [Bdellovibrio sp. ArHS]KHD89602.1 MAG: sensor protein kdpD [Bdellovibrio sp. ArHS]
MNRKALIKMSLFGILLALVLSVTSLLFLNRFASTQASRFREEFLTFYASSLSRKIQKMSWEDLRHAKKILQEDQGFGPPPPFGPPGPHMPPPPNGFRPPRPPRPPGPPPGPEMWLVSETGEILAQKGPSKWNLSWSSLPRPNDEKKILNQEDFFRLRPSVSVIKLATDLPLFLVVRENKSLPFAPLLIAQAVLTSAMILIGLVIALVVLFFYLHRKSNEARSVLHRLEQGDLKARFEIRRFDEFAGLMVDFNRMAEEIEMLVGRIHTTEKKRKELLQELGHDLRTPLTSLKTNFETLELHHEKLGSEEKHHLFSVLNSEVDYLKDLLEKLMTIAALDEPHYKATTAHIDLQELLLQEIKTRQNASGNSLTWTLDTQLQDIEGIVLGDPHLILRLLRNGLDNASRYAETRVHVELKKEKDKLQIHINDDGPGFDDESLKNFGVRKEFQGRKITKGGHISLGLGAVIMRTIAELHNGSIHISNQRAINQKAGASLKIELPLSY